ncbi:MAG: hypothetical protein K8R68_09755, partial [Bacteroidales bacterium]|nr:hypothetical protein [Bacteroidales bacterium]
LKKKKIDFRKIASFLLNVLALSIFDSLGQGFYELYSIVQYPAIPDKYCDLHRNMNETSGLMLYDGNLWTFNDSGGKPELYRIDKNTGKISQKVVVLNGENIDWEDITHDQTHIFIGDFGNNRGNREDLKIYKILKKEIGSGKNIKVNAEIILFSYNDQNSFEINNRSNDFDCESLISYGDSLILFSKNWVNGKTRIYKLPKFQGSYGLDPLDDFDVDGLVSGADFNFKTKELVLAGYKDHVPFVFLFSEFSGQNFDDGKVFRINFVRLKDSQIEGIVWLDNNNIILSTEQTSVFEQAAYKLNLKDIVKYVDE